MKPFLFAILFALLPVSAVSQTVKYSYDNSGNRIKRVMTDTNVPAVQSRAMPKIQSAMIADKSLRIYPSPTTGEVKVEIAGLNSADKCIIEVFNSSGQQIISQKIVETVTTLDITRHSAGIYILNVAVNDSKTTCKIIKR